MALNGVYAELLAIQTPAEEPVKVPTPPAAAPPPALTQPAPIAA
jgi:hypothetical protein